MSRRLLSFLILFPCATVFADTITNVAALGHCLMHEDAPYGRFALRSAVVLHQVSIYEGSSILSLEDTSGTAPVFYTVGHNRPEVRIGDILRMTGHMVQPPHPSYYAIPEVAEASLLRHGPEPKPVEANLRTVIGGSLDWRLVRVSGFIREAVRSDTNASWMHMTLCADGQLLQLAVPLVGGTPGDFEELVGATVAVTGICNPQDYSKRLYQGRVFHCSGREAFHVIKPRSGDPFDAPTIASLHYRTPNEIATLGLHRVSGRVITVWQKKHVLIRTSQNEPVELVLADDVMPQVGSTIDAVGYPESNLFNLILTRACWRPGGDVIPPDDAPPTELDVKGSSQHRTVRHGTRVTLEGIVAHRSESDGDAMIVEHDGELVNQLTHPRYEHKKTYFVKVAGRWTADKLATLRSPLTLDDGYTIRPVPVEVLRENDDHTRLLRFVLGEGRKRQIRKMCSAAHLVVLQLKRVCVGRFELPRELKPGDWRDLTADEIAALRG